jgi:hypothetical protein
MEVSLSHPHFRQILEVFVDCAALPVPQDKSYILSSAVYSWSNVLEDLPGLPGI